MIDPENLRTASLYINNQLLSRGLLRDGHSIDFAHPGDTEGEVSETMSRIISVVNDLILRRDRDAEHRESLSTTLRALRAESLRQANDIQRLQEKCADAQRKAGISEAAEASLRTQLRSAEANIHRLKEEAARTRTLVAQTRAACANEVRKRDRQIESLKKAVAEAGRARGAGKAVGVTSITVVGDVGGEPEVVVPGAEGQHGGVGDLRAETNAFLAQLAKSLSEENENLLALIRRTVEQLKDMSGWDTVAGAACGVQGEHGDGHALVLAANPADLAYEVDAVLEHLRTILTNPSFVPIEEVVVREDEIHRLRDGWEKMESRWKEAVHLIDGWRKRMQNSGRPVNVEELKMGLRLSPVKVKNVEETAHGYNLKLESGEDEEDDEEDGDGRPRTPSEEGPLDLVPEQHDAEAVDSEEGEEEEGEFDEDDDVDVDELDVEEPNVEILQHSLMMASPPYLRETRTSANRGPRPGRHHNKKHSRLFPAITEEKTYEVDTEEDPIPPPPPPHAEKPRQSPKKLLLSLRPVPPEEAAEVALPPSAALSAPDGWTNSPSDPTPEERVSKASAPAKLEPRAAAAASAAAATTKRREAAKKTDAAVPAKRDPTARRPVTTTKRKDTDPTKPTTRTTTATGPTAATTAKLRTAAQRPPITRGRSDTRSDDKQSTTTTTTRPARAPSSASASSARSAATTTNNGKHTTTGDPTASPTRRPNPSPAPSPTRSPQRGVNSRLPLPRPERAANGAVTATASGSSLLPPPQQSPVNMATIAAKLAASEREADAARVRAKLKAARSAAGSKGCATAAAAPVTLPPRPPSCVEGGEQGDAAQWGSLNRSCEAASLVAAASTSSSSGSGSGSGSGCGSASSSVEDGSRPRSVATAATGVSSSASSFKEEGEGGEECDEVDMVEGDEEEGEEDGVAGEEGVNQDDEEQEEEEEEEEDELGLSPVERPQQPAPATQAQGRKERRQPLRKDKTSSSKQTLAVQKRTQKQAFATTNTTQGAAAVKRAAAPAKLPAAATTADGGLAPPRKRERRTSKIAGAGGGSSSSSSRRRSTLSPWELDALIQGGTVTVDR